MDDRIRRDASSEKEEGASSNSIREDLPENNSTPKVNTVTPDAGKINPTGHKVKRFEVHIPESSDFYAGEEKKNDVPARIPAPQTRPAQQGQPPKRPVRPAGQQGRPVQPGRPAGRPAPGGNMPIKKTATGVPSPVSPKTQQAAQKAAEKKAKETEKMKKKNARTAEKLEAKKAKNLERAEKKKEKNKNFGYNFAKGILVTCLCLIFIGTIVTVVSSVAFGFINDVLVVDDENKNYSVTVEIPEGATYDEIFDILVDKGVVTQPLLTDFFCRFRHYDLQTVYDEETWEPLIDEATGKVVKEPVEYLPGVYHIDADSGIETILDSMLANNYTEKDTVRLTFPEGWTIAEVFEKIEKYEVCEAEKLYANLDIVANQYPFLSSIPDNEGRYSKAEGYLFPDTYDFYIGENASSVLEKLFTNFKDRWTADYTARLKELGLTVDQVITIASIIQSEAKDGSQMADVSSVIHNRLNNSASYPTLDMDSTADYIKILRSYNLLSDVHYSMYIESYNTYSQIGIPPGPICNPGETAIKAALYPNETNYYFFCHDSNGEIYLASTASAHQANVERVIYGNVEGTN